MMSSSNTSSPLCLPSSEDVSIIFESSTTSPTILHDSNDIIYISENEKKLERESQKCGKILGRNTPDSGIDDQNNDGPSKHSSKLSANSLNNNTTSTTTTNNNNNNNSNTTNNNNDNNNNNSHSGHNSHSSTTNSDYYLMRSWDASSISPFINRNHFHYSLDAPTACKFRKTEDSLTYINKDVFYGLSLEYTGPMTKRPSLIESIVMVDFREKKPLEDTLVTWEFWHSRQMSEKLRIIDVDTKVSSGVDFFIPHISYNAIGLRWSPTESPAFIMIAIRCLSTDFSTQKGIKGIPLQIQIDSSDKNGIFDRAYCQIKIFCDKGAERKSREDEKRLFRDVNKSGSRSLSNCQTSQPRSVFTKSHDLVSEPIYFNPKEFSSLSNTVSSSSSSSSALSLLIPERKKPRLPELPLLRIMIYVRQETEDVFTPLHISPPSVTGLVKALTSKYQIDANNIRFLYRRDERGIVVKIDDDMLKYYCNEDAFILEVLAFEESSSTSSNILHDVILVDIKTKEIEDKNNNNNINNSVVVNNNVNSSSSSSN